MSENNISDFGICITRLINKEDLTRQEACDAFSVLLNNETSEMQQGAFLAALTAKGETKEEIAGSWEAIYENDTVKVSTDIDGPIVENCGTGMDTFKTFNISTGASLIAASDGIFMARHGARALTSKIGTVDMAEALGVDVECDAELAAASLKTSCMALFNGMSPKIHPVALGRILSQISFGSTLNIAASLASPVKVDIGVRGVYSREMIRPVVEVMKEIGYKKALVMHGTIDNMTAGMDEASVSGVTFCAELHEDGTISEFSFRPEDAGLVTHAPEALLSSGDISLEGKRFVELLEGRGEKVRLDAAALNAALIFYITQRSDSIKAGTEKALAILESSGATETLCRWVTAQNRDGSSGMEKLNRLRAN
ncbi:MAG: anthranilate phosphoribosyltransferase [Candidatus Sabulitectum sp.]|nr:anthranilate phosphoribosyltransferase [Candidatus Sabulitectum sp.]